MNATEQFKLKIPENAFKDLENDDLRYEFKYNNGNVPDWLVKY